MQLQIFRPYIYDRLGMANTDTALPSSVLNNIIWVLYTVVQKNLNIHTTYIKSYIT